MLFLVWFDDTPKRSTAQKLEAAVSAYAVRFGTAPTLILVSEADAGATWPGAEVRVERRVGKDNFQLGRSE